MAFGVFGSEFFTYYFLQIFQKFIQKIVCKWSNDQPKFIKFIYINPNPVKIRISTKKIDSGNKS